MKTFLKTLIIFLLIGIPFSSCDDVESLADIDFNSSMSTDLNVVVPATTVSYKSAVKLGVSFSNQNTIDPKSDPTFKKYADKIKSIKVQEVTATVTKISKPVKIESGTLSIFQGSKKASWSISNFDVAIGKKISLDSAEGQFATINSILNSKNVFTAIIEGTVDDDNVAFTVVILIKADIVANPLK